MLNLIWGPDFQTGIAEIDADHRELFKIYNNLVGLMEMGGGEEFIGETLAELIDYTRIHFSREEELLATRGCPEDAMEKHRFEHQVLLDEISLLLDTDVTKRSNRLSNETLKFLGEWLIQHTQGTDKQCAAMVNL
ncbi:MAG: hemerythrin family protein [Rhodospirillales bacterium]|nr:hemerythrin family protein [Rhodospirillales bacterium]